MLKLFDSGGNALGYLTAYRDLCEESDLSSGDRSLSFTLLSMKAGSVTNECYIETAEERYVVKEKGISSSGFPEFKCQLDLEDLETSMFEQYTAKDQTLEDAALLALSGTGWRVSTSITKKRSVQTFKATPLTILGKIRDAWMCEIRYDTKNKIVTFAEKFGSDKGVYFIRGLNLKSLNLTVDSYDYYTRLIPIGKDGLKITEVNDGKEYVENTQYSSKIRTLIWEDTSYEDAEELMADAVKKLEDLSQPKKSYQADIRDLANYSGTYSVMEFSLGDTVTLIDEVTGIREKQRIVKMTVYPDSPLDNSCELSNTVLTFEEQQEKLEAAAAAWENVTNADGTINGVYVHGVEADGIVGIETTIGNSAAVQNLQDGVSANTDSINAVVQDLTAVTARVGSLEATSLTVTEAEITYATIENLSAANETVHSLQGDYAEFKTAAAEELAAHAAVIDSLDATYATITDLDAANAAIKNLDASFARIDLANIEAGVITTAMIGTGVVGTEQIADSSITDAKIVSLTASKISAGKIDAGVITVVNLSADNITTGSLNGQRLADGAVSTAKIASGAVSTAKIAEKAVTASLIAADAVTADKIAAGAVTAAKIASKTITANQIAAGTITSAEIAAGTIKASNIDVTNLFAQTIEATGTISGMKIITNSGTIGGWSINSSGINHLDSDTNYYVKLCPGTDDDKNVLFVRHGTGTAADPYKMSFMLRSTGYLFAGSDDSYIRFNPNAANELTVKGDIQADSIVIKEVLSIKNGSYTKNILKYFATSSTVEQLNIGLLTGDSIDVGFMFNKVGSTISASADSFEISGNLYVHSTSGSSMIYSPTIYAGRNIYLDAIGGQPFYSTRGIYTTNSNCPKPYCLIGDNGSNIWIGTISTTGAHHVGGTYISAGLSISDTSKGNSTINVGVPTYNSSTGEYTCTIYPVLHSGNYGSYAATKGKKTNGTATTKTIATAAWTLLASVTVSAGGQFITANASFPNNASGQRRIFLTTSNTAPSSLSDNLGEIITQTAVSGSATNMSLTKTHRSTSNVTYYLFVYQNSGSSLSVTGSIDYMVI